MGSVDEEPTRTKIGPRGRLTIPVALQRAAGVAEGEEVVIRVVGPGVFAIESVQSIEDGLLAEFASIQRPTDAVAAIRADREDDDRA
ncbi:AbrB/MazE/SpoVT family DNA-binding domain-containing protein [Kitasatospora sp. NPDC001603]|uniref:AbrB/MazE/SpoVT family DNA-binding domain-containing protein n=1 Tax=Kitasatospora sp. NPDC001603 TaxID=3154388 RepID=UPI0033179803